MMQIRPCTQLLHPDTNRLLVNTSPASEKFAELFRVQFVPKLKKDFPPFVRMLFEERFGLNLYFCKRDRFNNFMRTDIDATKIESIDPLADECLQVSGFGEATLENIANAHQKAGSAIADAMIRLGYMDGDCKARLAELNSDLGMRWATGHLSKKLRELVAAKKPSSIKQFCTIFNRWSRNIEPYPILHLSKYDSEVRKLFRAAPPTRLVQTALFGDVVQIRNTSREAQTEAILNLERFEHK